MLEHQQTPNTFFDGTLLQQNIISILDRTQKTRISFFKRGNYINISKSTQIQTSTAQAKPFTATSKEVYILLTFSGSFNYRNNLLDAFYWRLRRIRRSRRLLLESLESLLLLPYRWSLLLLTTEVP